MASCFFAGLQIELSKESGNLIFENEHLLGTKPTQIDVIVVKKNKNIPITRNIGQLFRKYNIIEYKSPSDYLGVDDFYKVYAYACFYKSLFVPENSIDISEITISFVSQRYPRKLIKHLSDVRHLKILKVFPGIYYIKGDFLPIQFIITSRLNINDNLWLYSLTDKLSNEQAAFQLLSEYTKHQNKYLYESVMDMVIAANAVKSEDNNMSKVLNELIEKKLNARERYGFNTGISQGFLKGEQYFATLTQKLLFDSRLDDLQKAASDSDFRQKLYAEYNIKAEPHESKKDRSAS